MAAEARGRTYLTGSADAQPVQVFRSSVPDPAADQVLVDFLGTLALRSRPGLRAQVELRARNFATAETLGAGRRRGFGVEWCRRQRVERLSVIVRRRAGAGPFALRVTWPG